MLTVFFFILGLILGSFINCLVYRLHTKQTILGRSFCPRCQHTLSWGDLIPFFSYLFLKAKCRYCHQKIALQYFLVELGTGLIFSWGYGYYFMSNITVANPILSLGFYLIISTFLIIIFVYDLKYYLIADIIVWPAIGLALLFNILLGKDILNLLLAGGIGLGFFGLQYLVSKGKWIGGGDLLIGLLMGFFLGYPRVLIAIFLAYISGSILALILLIFQQRDWSSKVPLGPFLVAASLIVFLYGSQILDWYLNIF